MGRPRVRAPATGALHADISEEWLFKLLEKSKIINAKRSVTPERISIAVKKLRSAKLVAAAHLKMTNFWLPKDAVVKEATESLNVIFPQVEGELREIERSWRGAAVGKHAAKVREDVADLIDHVERVRQGIAFFTGRDGMPPAGAWREIASGLANLYFEMVEAQKQTLSSRGPASKFVAAVLPFITGDAPSIENVTQHLKALKKQKDKTA